MDTIERPAIDDRSHLLAQSESGRIFDDSIDEMVDLAAEGYRLLAGVADSGALRAAFVADVAAFAPAKKK